MAEKKTPVRHYRHCLGEETLQSRKHTCLLVSMRDKVWVLFGFGFGIWQRGLRSTTSSLSLQILYDPIKCLPKTGFEILYCLHIPVYPSATEQKFYIAVKSLFTSLASSGTLLKLLFKYLP